MMDQAEKRIAELLRVYEAAKARLDAVARATQGEYTRERAISAQRQIDTIIRGLEDVQATWARDALPSVYVDRRIADIDVIEKKIGKFTMGLDFNLIDQRKVALAVEATIADLTKGTESMKTFYGGWVMRSGFVEGAVPALPPSLGFTQTGLDRKMTSVIAEGIAAGETRRATSRVLQEELAKVTGEGGKVVIRCVDGVVRKYDPKKYAELVVRTRTREISTESTRQTMRSAFLKYDIAPLYQVSESPDPCEECAEFDGKIFSEFPNDPKYPFIGTVSIPPHPNCRHVLIPFVEVTEEEAQLIREAA